MLADKYVLIVQFAYHVQSGWTNKAQQQKQDWIEGKIPSSKKKLPLTKPIMHLPFNAYFDLVRQTPYSEML